MARGLWALAECVAKAALTGAEGSRRPYGTASDTEALPALPALPACLAACGSAPKARPGLAW